VWKVLSGIPIEVYDEEEDVVWESATWELCQPRSQGDYAGSREIGSANLLTAYNLFYIKHLTTHATSDALADFKQVLQELEARKQIRRHPELVRQSFKVV